MIAQHACCTKVQKQAKVATLDKESIMNTLWRRERCFRIHSKEDLTEKAQGIDSTGQKTPAHHNRGLNKTCIPARSKAIGLGTLYYRRLCGTNSPTRAVVRKDLASSDQKSPAHRKGETNKTCVLAGSQASGSEML